MSVQAETVRVLLSVLESQVSVGLSFAQSARDYPAGEQQYRDRSRAERIYQMAAELRGRLTLASDEAFHVDGSLDRLVLAIAAISRPGDR